MPLAAPQIIYEKPVDKANLCRYTELTERNSELPKAQSHNPPILLLLIRFYTANEEGCSIPAMSIDIGSTVEGTVVKLADYGAIVRLQDGKTGLIHISEIANTYVRDVKDYFKEQDRVRVKVLSVNDKGRYELSTKQIEQPLIEPTPRREKRKPAPRPPEIINLGPEPAISDMRSMPQGSFEDRLSQYLKDSQERLHDIKRSIESKRGVKRY